MTEPTAVPVTGKERLGSLDVLRGFALLGILIMNIQSFAMIGSAYTNPAAYGDLTGANKAVWIVSHVVADTKMMTLFSMLFGAGIVLMTTRAEARGRKPAGLHYRRMFWLMLIGLAHAHLIWMGDILFTYAVCGSLAFLARKLRPVVLVVIALLLLLVPTMMSVGFHFAIPEMGEKDVAPMRATWQPSPEKVQKELDTYRSGWLTQMPERSRMAFWFETMLLLFLFLWRATANMLIGMALFKWGVLKGEKSPAFYTRLAVVGGLVGLPLVVLGVRRNFEHGWSFEDCFALSQVFNYWGSLFVALMWMGIVLALHVSGAFTWLRDRLAAVGRMAFTNYLAQSLICTTIFYGLGLGRFGHFSRVEQAMTVVGVWVVLIAWSKPWLDRFRFGPAEWLWRSLTYWQRQPMRR